MNRQDKYYYHAKLSSKKKVLIAFNQCNRRLHSKKFYKRLYYKVKDVIKTIKEREMKLIEEYTKNKLKSY